MSDIPPRQDHRRDLPFFGRIAAGVTHDMRNVLSIIDQYAGLLEDLTRAAEDGPPLEGKKLLEISAHVRRQAHKGAKTMERFSRFAHAADEGAQAHDLTKLVENMAALAERHVAQAACRLETDLQDEAILVLADPYGLQYAVFAAMELLLQFLEKGRLLTVKVTERDANAVISVAADAGDGADMLEFSQRASHLVTVVDELGGSVEISSSDGTVTVELLVPKV